MQADQPNGWVLYDDDCGFCRRWVPFWGPTLRKVGLEIAPLQAPWVAPRLGLDHDELVYDIRILLADGSHLAGAEVYRYAVQHIWWAYPLYLFSVAPGLRRLWDWGYRTFADHRHEFSAVCNLPPASAETHPMNQIQGRAQRPELTANLSIEVNS
ncbi:MAG: DUF393 domain-containing protein [Anaerolineae bacterium]|nr:DUF393 domain-containing protein [Anaerolineae bacterium]MCO5243065.1 DUF393 domain-containing protein [Anaerolineae bacterium]